MTSTLQTIISLGSNADGAWGSPEVTLERALSRIQGEFGKRLRISRRYRSRPLGSVRQADFFNQVAIIDTPLAPARILRFFKMLEREAGRRPGTSRRWGPRPLDLDLVASGGVVTGWRARRRADRPGRAPSSLILPHPSAHLRAFVLVPLAELALHWRHPVLDLDVGQMLLRLPGADRKALVALPGGT